MFAFHRFVINMVTSGDCVTERLNINLFVQKKIRRRKENSKSIFIQMLFSTFTTRRIFVLIVTRLIESNPSYRIIFALYFTTGVHSSVELLSIFGSVICYRVRVSLSLNFSFLSII